REYRLFLGDIFDANAVEWQVILKMGRLLGLEGSLSVLHTKEKLSSVERERLEVLEDQVDDLREELQLEHSRAVFEVFPLRADLVRNYRNLIGAHVPFLSRAEPGLIVAPGDIKVNKVLGNKLWAIEPTKGVYIQDLQGEGIMQV
ncbi:unnamed protein product, partial [Amoebophrya sp. A25]